MRTECLVDEPIEVCRVKLRRDSSGQAAIVSDVLAAERLVAEWSKAALRKVACRILVQFSDGLVLEGSFLIGGRARQPSLGKYLRDAFEEIQASRNQRAELPGRGALAIPAHLSGTWEFGRYALATDEAVHGG